jgi:membrane associated rhomboid family serine protease
VTPSALSIPLLVVTLLSLAVFAMRTWRAGPARLLLDWWLAIAAVCAVCAVSFALPSLRPLGGALSFAALSLAILAPMQLERAASRASRLAHRRSAVVYAWLAALLHPSRRNRKQPRAIHALLALRVGREPTDAQLREISEDNAAVRRALDTLVLHSRGDVRAVAERVASADERELYYQMGMGLVVLRATALLDPTPDGLVRTVAEISALDPSMRDPDRRALLVAFTLAYAGDREGAFDASEQLAPYLAPGEPDAVRALALHCAGDTEGSARMFREAIARHASNEAAVYSLKTLASAVASLPEPRVSLHSAALADLIERLRAEQRSLAATAPLDGRTATPWLTTAWSAVLVLAYVWLSRRGNPFDPEHLARSGALVTSEYEFATTWPTLFTHGLLHAGVLHLAFNLLAFASFGRFCEAFYGRFRAAAIYLLAAVTSGAAVAHFADPLRPTVLVGASGSIFALGGAVAAAALADRELRASRRGRREVATLFALFAVQSVMDRMIPGVAATAHTAGLLTGLVAGFALALTVRRRPARAAVTSR